MAKQKISIGLDVKVPSENCADVHCAYHGKQSVRGREFKGTVISSVAQKTVVVEWPRFYFIPKYERYEKRKSRIKAHNPSCINVKEGDTVKIVECKPISKTKHFVVVAKLK